LYCKYLAAAAGVGTAQSANTSLAVLLLQVIVLRLDSLLGHPHQTPSRPAKEEEEVEKTQKLE
jgi:hypothetical protein